MSKIEIDTETTRIETAEITVCDNCGLEAGDDATCLVANPTATCTLGRRGMSDLSMRLDVGSYPGDTRGRSQLDLSEYAEIDSDGEFDICDDCMTSIFNATPQTEQIALNALSEPPETPDSTEAEDGDVDRGWTARNMKRIATVGLVASVGVIYLSAGGFLALPFSPLSPILIGVAIGSALLVGRLG